MSSPRAPVFSRFIVSGAILGALLGVLAAALSKPAPDYTRLAAYGYFGLIGAVLGGIAGAVVAVVLDRPSRR